MDSKYTVVAKAQTSTYAALAAKYRAAVAEDARSPSTVTEAALMAAANAKDAFANVFELTVSEQEWIGLSAWSFDETTFEWSEGA